MITTDLNFSGGFLLYWTGGSVESLDLCASNQLEFIGKIGSTFWEKFILRSARPLLRKDEASQTTFTYNVLVRRGHERLLILSDGKAVVEELVTGLNSALPEQLNTVPIAVDRLVRDIVTEPDLYFLTLVHARMPAGGAMLRSASFYGENLGGARWFRGQLDLMKFYGCGLRRADGGPELIQVNSDGAIYCHNTEPRRLPRIQAAITFLHKGGYLSDLSISSKTTE